MSDSIDRVFVKAISTIRTLSTRSGYGALPRPPIESRVRLYGLYKQATEGNVEGIMPRPGGTTAADRGAQRKWDAWKEQANVSKTEAKRRYISFLIDTMSVYASGTHEARELLGELEYLWDQIKTIVPDEREEHDDFREHRAGFREPHSVFANSAYGAFSAFESTGRNTPARSYVGHSLSGSVHLSRTRGEPGPNAPSPSLEMERWQEEVTSVINQLSREVYTSRQYNSVYGHSRNHEADDPYATLGPLPAALLKVAHTVRRALKPLLYAITANAVVFWLGLWAIRRSVRVVRVGERNRLVFSLAPEEFERNGVATRAFLKVVWRVFQLGAGVKAVAVDVA